MNKEQLEANLTIIQTQIDYWLNMQHDLKAEFAEAAKPELRHGDYGICKSSEHFCLYARRNNQMELFGEAKGSGHPFAVALSDHLILGNIFDDLKALQEPLEVFEMRDEQNERIVRFVGKPGNLYIELCEVGGGRARNINISLAEASLKFRRLVHTAESKQR